MRRSLARSGWRGVALIAIVYVYFLIFAQFAFLARLSELGLTGFALKLIMAAMAAGGILLSLVTPRVRALPDPALRLRTGFALSAAAALLTLFPLSLRLAVLVGFLIGAALGITTVTLVTHLRGWTGERGAMFKVGLGTGIAYLVCNVPYVFTATPRMQALLAAVLCGVAAAMPRAPAADLRSPAPSPRVRISFPYALAAFAVLIWLDSAAFYIIQHTSSLKAGTWAGNAHLWADGALHFGAAIVAAVLIERGHAWATLALAVGALGFACVLLQNPALIPSASLFYPAGVSLYSVALVAYPSLLTGADTAAVRGKQAGWIYAIAGWMGSAMGIGMGQNLGRVPLAMVVVAGIVVLAPLCVEYVKRRPREILVVAATAAVALLVSHLLPDRSASADLNAVERGRQVYISEGCISCHSQYVRPNSSDVLMWGPVESLASIHSEQPPLIGNRRQGPDLAEVGLRRSQFWLMAHLVDPAGVSYHSPMPSYAFLFRDGRGSDLIAYLASLRSGGDRQQLQLQAVWQPSPAAWAHASSAVGAEVYRQHCATCHDQQGTTRMRWRTVWRKSPPDAAELHTFAQSQPRTKLAQIAKFGIPGTDMAGHEYLNDELIASVADWLKFSDESPYQTSAHH